MAGDSGSHATRAPAAASRAPATRPESRKEPLAVRLRLWRSRRIASPGFRALIARLPGFNAIANRHANDLFRLTSGFVQSQVLTACVRVGLLQALVDRCLSASALADICALPPARMELLLAMAESLGLVTRAADGRFLLADAGAVVAADRGLTAMILHHEMLYADLAHPDRLLRAEDADTRTRRYWAYVRNDSPDRVGAEDAAAYSALMRDSQSMLAECILQAHDFGRYRRVLDLGGGEGAFLAALGGRHPGVRLDLFDLPAVAERARDHLAARGLAAVSQVHAGDFTRDALPHEADCVTLVRVLCDHDTERVRAILANLHRALRPGTRVVVVEAMAGASEGARLAAVYFGMYFLAMGSGRCRSAEEIATLLAEAGFTAPRHHKTATPLLASLVIARR